MRFDSTDWQLQAQWSYGDTNSGTLLADVLTTWNVPEDPYAKDGQIVYFFTCISTTDYSSYVANVLYWDAGWALTALASPAIGNPHAIIPAGVTSLPQSEIRFAAMDPGGTAVEYNSFWTPDDGHHQQVSFGQTSLLSVSLTVLTIGMGAYGTKSCGDFPVGTTDASNIQLLLQNQAGYDAPPQIPSNPIQWQLSGVSSICDYSVAVKNESPSEGDIEFTVPLVHRVPPLTALELEIKEEENRRYRRRPPVL